ncbi:MAG: T9SS type A sorting domain-containing protein [Saprospiraceae bacterium]|nr:T9SS type A sorting domain-containing protein [Saprospiraceae bacterium]
MLTFSGRIAGQTTDCGQVYDITVGTASISTIPNLNTWTPGKTIWVTGTLTVDQSITFDNLQFIMKENSAILISGANVVMTAQNGTDFSGCKRMWWGITVQNGASVKMTGAQIKQAYAGLKFVPGANTSGSELQNCFLEDNLFGLFAYNFSVSNPLKFSKFSGNTIQASINALLSPPAGVTYNGVKPWRGIWLLNCNADLATGASTFNKVKGYRYGMVASNANVTLANCRFDSNYGDPQAFDLNDGVDIFADQSNLSVGGFANQQCRFSNTRNAAILSKRTKSLLVSGAKFEGSHRYGVRCINSDLAAAIVVVNNEFLISDPYLISAIRIERPAGGALGSGVLVLGNQITAPASISTFKQEKILIDVVGLQYAYDQVNIRDNQLNVLTPVNRIHGIRISGKGDNFGVWDANTLDWMPSPNPNKVNTSFGILAKDLTGTAHFVNNNQIASKLSGNNSFLHSAIQARNLLGGTLICDNTLDNTHKGLEGISGLPLTQLKTNDIGNAAYGLYCAAGTNMMNQWNHENIWTGNYNLWGAFYNGTPGFFFYYDPNNSIPNDVPPSLSPSYWFQTNIYGSNSNCDLILPAITERERTFIEGTAVIDTSAGNWDARRELLYKLLRYPALCTEDPDAAAYLDEQIQLGAGPILFARAEWLFDKAFALSGTHQALCDQLMPDYRFWADSLLALDYAQAADTATYDAAIAQQRAVVFGQIAAVCDSLDGVRANARADADAQLLPTLTYAQNLPQGKMYEANLRNLLCIGIRQAYAGDTVLNSGDYQTLRSIAGQCPAIGGISVRRAPLHLPHEEDVTYAANNWTDGCGAYQRAAPAGPAPADAIAVFPNPASQQITITCAEPRDNNWQIRDLRGRLRAEGQFDRESGALQLPLTDWPAGLYVLSVYEHDGRVTTIRFAVIR